jgi:alkanesulfonate monooxygenase SsuD/methylene tetrahydromethanopterin reductase-like flavin-dependent oxidoreductase (luciferase family)
MEEGLTIVKGLWQQETFSFEGKYYDVPPFSLTPRPVQTKAPLWVAATVEKAFDRAARFQANLAGNGHGFDVYDKCLRNHGHDPADFNKAILEMVYLADTEERAWKQFGPYVLDLLRNYQIELEKHGELKHFKNQPGGYFGVDPLPEAHELDKLKQLHFLNSPFIVGTPDVAIKEVQRIRQMGVTHMNMQMQFGGMDPRLVEHSMRLFASEVMPNVAP